MILIKEATSIEEIGAKAYTLLSLGIKNTPKLYVVPASFFERENIAWDELKSEILNTLDKTKLYAVRSSAIDEDSGSNSFAGIHSSFLNITVDEVLANVEKVYKSAFSANAMEYRAANKLSTENIRIAVIIQEMVDADFAGVAFTINPVTNNPDEIVIAVTEGLGEKLVDGSVSGSTYMINGDSVNLEGKDILTKKQIDSIIALIAEVSSKTNRFQDIEFALCKEKVYFLQARPITTYQNIDPHGRTLLIDNANIIESYFGVVSPLTFSFAKDVYRDVYTATFRYAKVRESIIKSLSPSLSEMLCYYDGKVYYNMNSWYRVTSIFPFKKSTSYMENMMGVKSKTEDFKRVKLNAFDMIKFGVVFIDKLRKIEPLSRQFEDNFNRIVKPYYGREINGTNEELYRLFKTIESDIVKEFTVPIVNDCAVMIYFGMLKDKAKKLGISSDELNLYISNHGDVKSAGSASDLVKLIDKIRANAEIAKDFESMSNEELMKKYHNGSIISEDIEDYILTYGPRVRDELKLETTTMIEDPLMLYQMLKENLSYEHKSAVYNNTQVPKKIKKLTEKTKKFIKNRERLRLKRTYIYSVVRNIFLGFGRNLAAEGRINEARDVFYLTKDEVFFGKDDFKATVEARRREEAENAKKPIYNRVVFYGENALPVHRSNPKGELCGIPSGNGIVKARVSLLNSASDSLVPGNIILTKRTDPGWIALFPMASGLIVEHGSMLSHSFVVARELGLPAVVGVENATSIIPDGALVTLDGLKGEITIEDR